jgi:hypothetical protein
MRALIAWDCDGTVDIAGGPVPLELVRELCAKHVCFCIGARTLTNFVSIPWDQFPSKSVALARWKLLYPDLDRYVVVDDSPFQYDAGWEGWEFFSPLEFLREVRTWS